MKRTTILTSNLKICVEGREAKCFSKNEGDFILSFNIDEPDIVTGNIDSSVYAEAFYAIDELKKWWL